MESLVIMLKNVLVFVALALPDFFLVKNRMQIILMTIQKTWSLLHWAQPCFPY